MSIKLGSKKVNEQKAPEKIEGVVGIGERARGREMPRRAGLARRGADRVQGAPVAAVLWDGRSVDSHLFDLLKDVKGPWERSVLGLL